MVDQAPIRGFLLRHGWLLAIALTYLYAFPYFPKINSANELPRVYLVKAIADEHGFAIDRGVARWGSTADVSPSGGHQYSNKAPGSSMLATPPYLAARLVAGEPSLATSVWIARVFAGIVPSLLFLVLMYGFLERWVPEPAIRQLVLVAYGLGSMAMTYSILFYSHQLGAVCAASAWILALDAAERRRGLGALAAAGALAGAAALVDYQAVFAAVPVAVHVVVKLAGWPRRELLRAIAVATLAAAIPIAILLAYHAVCFGSPWRTGYDASVTFAANHQQGFLGLTELRWEAFYGSLVKIDNGLVALAPWLLLAIPGAFVLGRGLHWPGVTIAPAHASELPGEQAPSGYRIGITLELLGAGALLVVGGLLALLVYRGGGTWVYVPIVGALGVLTHVASRLIPARAGDPGTAVVGLAIIVVYVLFISAINFWRGGWGVGPRYITAMLPFALPLVAAMLAALRGRPIAFGVAASTLVIGVVIYTLSSLTFPYWPDSMQHPLYDVTLRMLREDLVAPNLASVAGIDGVLGIVPIVALVGWVLGRLIQRIAGWRGLLIAVGLAAGVLALYGLLPRGGTRADASFRSVRAAVIDVTHGPVLRPAR